MALLPETGETISGFTVTELGTIHMLGARTVDFYHEVSGARLLYIQNDDRELGFNIIYRTPQLDERDSSHILEHLILSSCRKYPSRDVFFDMDSKSYTTFMNGLTDNTFTCYPVCTQSQNQLMKLMDVFLCCMEEPDALKDRNYYLREGIRFELEKPEGPLTMQGTVLSEDWGHLTDLEENADSSMAHTLYKGQRSANLLGRAHLHYKELSYEQAQETFRRCYSYSNCLMVLYGDMDYKSILEFLDREHLSGVSSTGPSELSSFREPVLPGFRTSVSKSPAYMGSPAEHASVMDYGIDLSSCSQEELIYWDLLADILDNDTSAWHRYAREEGLNNVTEVYLDLMLPKPALKFRMRNADPCQKEAFLDSIQKALEDISQNGMPWNLYQAAMKEHRLSDSLTREAPHLAFNISEEIGRYWSLTGETGYFQLYETAFRKFQDDSDQVIVRRLAASALHPQASALVVTVPQPGLAEQMEDEKEQFLKEKLASMTDQEKEQLIAETHSFSQWNAREWSNMDFLIRPEELPKPEVPSPYTRRQHGTITAYTAPAPAQGVGAYHIYFDISSIGRDDLNYITLYQMLLTELDTRRFTVEQQKTLEQEYLHDCTFDELYPGPEAGPLSRPMMSVFWYALTEDFETGLDFLLDVMEGGDYSDTDTIIRVLEKYLPDYDLSKGESASALAFSLAEGYIRQECRFRNMLNSQENYYFLKDVLRRLKEEPGFPETVTDKLKHVSQAILNRGHLVFLAAAPPEVLEQVEETAVRRLRELACPETPDACSAHSASGKSHAFSDDSLYGGSALILPSQKQKLAVCVEASCQETRLIGDFRGNAGFKGRYLPFLMAVADKYLKPAIRYQGGAYDSGIDFYIPTGYFSLWSTADPDVGNTLDIFLSSGRQLMELPLTRGELEGYILNAYAQALPPQGALNSRMRYMRRDMVNIDTNEINRMITDIRNARLEHQQEAARVMDEILKQGAVVTVGNEKCIMKHREMFDQVIVYRSSALSYLYTGPA